MTLRSCPVVTLREPFDSTVWFGLQTLERIETAMEMSTGELMMKLANMSGRTPDGQVDTAAALKEFSVRTVAKFVGACLDWKPDAVAATIPPAHLLEIFRDLCGGFSQAANQLYGVSDEEKPANPSAPSGGGN